MAELYVDAKDQIVGRLASKIAKELMKGNSVFVANAEKSVVSGNYHAVLGVYNEKISRGDPYHGPFFPKYPDRILKRAVRGMLPKNYTGRQALKRLKVFLSVPEEFKGKNLQKFKDAENRLECAHVELGEVSRVLAGR